MVKYDIAYVSKSIMFSTYKILEFQIYKTVVFTLALQKLRG